VGVEPRSRDRDRRFNPQPSRPQQGCDHTHNEIIAITAKKDITAVIVIVSMKRFSAVRLAQ